MDILAEILLLLFLGWVDFVVIQLWSGLPINRFNKGSGAQGDLIVHEILVICNLSKFLSRPRQIITFISLIPVYAQ